MAQAPMGSSQTLTTLFRTDGIYKGTNPTTPVVFAAATLTPSARCMNTLGTLM